VNIRSTRAGPAPPITVTTLSSPTSVVSTVAPAPTDCRSGSVSVAEPPAGPGTSVCLHAGATLTVTFDKSSSRATGVPGRWAVPPVRVVNPSTLGITATSTRGPLLTAVFSADAPGSTMVYASFDEECAGRDTTPCTIPPLAEVELNVTVVEP
jgi:hypothetical protein